MNFVLSLKYVFLFSLRLRKKVDEITKIAEGRNMNTNAIYSSGLKLNFLFLGFLLLSMFTGCSLEDFHSITGSQTEDNSTLKTVESEKLNRGGRGENSLLQLSKDIKKELAIQNAEQLKNMENSFKHTLESAMDTQVKFQFLCDGNEKWIYRCNTTTGKIECFSMSSNKLRLLSSVK